MSKYGIIFPGQGSQNTEMLSSYLESNIFKETIEEASSILTYDVKSVVQDESKLNKTEFTQPVVLAVSIAMWNVWKNKVSEAPTVAAGHSLGEYSALVANGWIPFAECLEIVKKRAIYMQEEMQNIRGGMAAIIGLERSKITELCEEFSSEKQIIEAVNFNSLEQTVVAGHLDLIEASVEKFKKAGAKLVKIIPVSIAAHTSLLKNCKDKLSRLLKNISFSIPNYPVLHNIDAESKDNETAIIESLTSQVHSPVEWEKTIENISSLGIKNFVEIGPGNVLAGLNKRINRELNTISIGNYTNIDDALELISSEK